MPHLYSTERGLKTEPKKILTFLLRPRSRKLRRLRHKILEFEQLIAASQNW